MSEALRQVFAEFGFKVDDEQLEALNKRLDDLAKKTKKTPEQTDKAAKGTKKVGDAAKGSAKEIKTFGDVMSRVTDAAAAKLGDKLRQQSTIVDNLAKRFNVSSEAVGKVFVGATLAAIGVMTVATHAAFAFAQSFAQQSEELRDVARDMRITTTQLQEFDHAASQSGVGVDRMRSGLAHFAEQLRAGERWGNSTTFLLRRLGINARDAAGHMRPMAEIMGDVAVALPRVESPFRRARVAVQLFGESGRRMLDVLHGGAGGLDAFRDELAELGGGVTPEAAEAARRFAQAQERLARTTDSLRSVLATSLLPVLMWVTNAWTKAEAALAKLTRGTHVVDVVLIALGVTAAAVAAGLLVAWGPVIAPFLAAAAAVAALVAVFDDLWTFFEGGDSALGRFVDQLFGVGTAGQYVHELREDFDGLIDLISRGIGKVADFVAAIEGLGDAMPDWARSGAAPPPVRIRPPRNAPPPSATTGGVTARSAGASVDLPVPTGANFSGANAMPGAPMFSVPVPATRAVPVPASVTAGARTVVHQRSVSQTNHLTVTTSDPRAAATEAVRLLEQQQRQQRDADHPLEDDDQ